MIDLCPFDAKHQGLPVNANWLQQTVAHHKTRQIL